MTVGDKPSIPIALGILVGLAASFVQSLGLTIQRKSHLQNDALPPAAQSKAHRRPLWLFGFAIFISSNVFGTIFQIGALPIVVLAPLGAVSLLWNAVLSRLLLGEHFSPSTLAGTLLIALGATLIAVFGVVPEETHTIDELLALFRRGPFVAYIMLMCVMVAGILLLSHILEFGIRRRNASDRIYLLEDDQESFQDSLGSRNPSPSARSAIPFVQRKSRHRYDGLPTSAQDERHVRIILPSDAGSSDAEYENRGPPSTPKPCKSLTLIGMSYAACSGTLSGLSLLFAKCGVELLVITFASGGKQNQFKSIQSWILLAGLGITALAQLFYLNHSLTLAGPALICPLAFCFYNISSIFDGLVFYSQFSELSRLQISLVTGGIVVLLIGVWSVSAIEPATGEGGVHLGSWADEISEDECNISDEHRLPFSDEPDQINLRGDSAVDSAPATPQLSDQGAFGSGSWPKLPRNHPVSPLPSHLLADPPRRHSMHTRYGTLIPELAPPGLPAGFSIGFNTSSPGFAIRSIHGNTADGEQDSLWRRRRRHSLDHKGRLPKRGLSLDMGALRQTDRSPSARASSRTGTRDLTRSATSTPTRSPGSANEYQEITIESFSSRRRSWAERLFRPKTQTSD